MISEKQFRTILFLLQIVLGIAAFIAAYTALTTLVDFSKFSLLYQQLSKYGKVTNSPYRNLNAGTMQYVILLLIFSIFQVLCGVLVRLKTARWICAIIFAIEWLSWPLGTLLGSFGLYWVTRDWSLSSGGGK